MKKIDTCIIILNWNGKEMVKDCLSSLFKLTNYPNYKVIVVDNGSTDGSIEFVKKNFKKADVLALNKNYGFVIGNNKGMKYALKKYNPKYILLLNNDTEIIQKDWLTQMIKAAESDKKIGIVGCNLLFSDKTIQFRGIRKLSLIIPPFPHFITKEKSSHSYYSLFIPATCFLIKRELISTIGFFDEIFAPFSAEDGDFCMRAIKNGFKIFHCGEASIVHKIGLSTKKIEEKTKWFVFTKNHFLFLLKHFPQFFLIGFLGRLITSFLTIKDRRKGLSIKNLVFNPNGIFLFFITIKAAIFSFSIFLRSFKS